MLNLLLGGMLVLGLKLLLKLLHQLAMLILLENLRIKLFICNRFIMLFLLVYLLMKSLLLKLRLLRTRTCLYHTRLSRSNMMGLLKLFWNLCNSTHFELCMVKGRSRSDRCMHGSVMGGCTSMNRNGRTLESGTLC